MTTSTLPPPTSLNLPEPVYGHPGHAPGSPRRPPSPLRNEFTHRRLSNDSHSGDDDDDGEEEEDRTWPRSRSPTSASVTQFAANLANRVNSFISPSITSRPLPSDEELEAEAQRERDRSRREAERILTREAEERRAVEERVLAMMNSSPQSNPPSRSRSQTLPNPPSPAHSQKESGPSWWTAAKARLTPTKDKEPLTPAQQVIEETKAREKDTKNTKGKEKEWPASSASKYTSPAYLNLKIPPGGPPPRTSSPTSPTPARPPISRTPVNLSPAPVTQAPINLSPASLQRGTSPGGSPAREPPPLYASFTPSGTLDVPGTLLLIAKRFEKLERWSVTHVRALEERMGDVERWLVDKENQRSKEREPNDKPSPESELASVRGDVTELQSRMTELGREMARLATSPAVLSSNTAIRDSPVMSTAPPTESSIISPHESTFSSVVDSTSTTSEFSSSNTTSALENIRSLSTPRRVPSLTARESTSPPLARVSSRTPSGTRTRLPYPTGDYASPGELISPTHTPASSPPQSAHLASMVISGLPVLSSPLELPAAISSPGRVASPILSGLPAPGIHSPHRGSVSPTPMQAGRKRYTVALGGPIVAPVEYDYDCESERSGLGTTSFSSPMESDDEDDENAADETLGKKAAFRAITAAKL
ncbi:uncharacterized protein EDB91DRAFT_1028366, partial [Suillus paluster]|uniref:uncharacterized protein n=1 Tax=Suillus paluster TaxID=48578 RepID=UPI001B87D8F7